MREYFIILTPEEPIITAGIKPKNDYISTRDYIPGSILRGSLAEWLKIQNRTDDILPLVQQVRFGNFFPTVAENVYSLPFPITALECKLKGGFRNVPKKMSKDAGHGIRDSLFIAFVYSELERMGAHFPVPMLLRCIDCLGRMEKVTGYYAKLPEGWIKVSTSKGVQTKVTLSRYRRTSQEQMLYRVVALRPRNLFIGRIWTDNEEILDILKEAVENIGTGALTTRGFGTVRLRVSEFSIDSIRERLMVFNETLHKVWSDLVSLVNQIGFKIPKKPEGTYFSVDLLSPAVLRNPQGLPTLKLYLKIRDKWLEPIWYATQPVFVGGFSTAWGLPKPTFLGAAQGSVYLFSADLPEEELVSELERIETQGVGELTNEGLGEVIICHPFHREVKQV